MDGAVLARAQNNVRAALTLRRQQQHQRRIMRRTNSEPFIASWDFDLCSFLGKNVSVTMTYNKPDEKELPQMRCSWSLPEGSTQPSGLTWNTTDSRIESGTKEALISLLFDPSPHFDAGHVDVILFAHHYFIRSKSLLRKLINRYRRAPELYSTGDAALDKDLVDAVQQRVLHVLARWARDHKRLMSEDIAKLFMRLLSITLPHHAAWSDYIKESLRSQLMQYASKRQSLLLLSGVTETDNTSMMVTLGTESFVDLVHSLWTASPIVGVHKLGEKKYKHSFFANDAVDYAVDRIGMLREELVTVGRAMLASGRIQPFNKAVTTFENAAVLFKFTDVKGVFEEPIVPSVKTISLLSDMHPVEFARQLALLEADLLGRLTPLELSHKAFEHKDLEQRRLLAGHVLDFAEHFNRMVAFCCYEVVTTNNFRQRVSTIRRFIQIAGICRQLNNFNAAMEITLALQVGCVSRLRRTWACVPKAEIAALSRLKEFFSVAGNYNDYRAAVRQVIGKGPVIPLLAIFMKDLVFIEEIPDYFKPPVMLNYGKLQKLADVFQQLSLVQRTQYQFKRIARIQKFLESINVVHEDKNLYAMSYLCEPPNEDAGNLVKMPSPPQAPPDHARPATPSRARAVSIF
eukprot:TRINITY_DN5389_c0_g1_i3.p1 TRINITY_DN5389_c0_g1~~TRINITY_DN5389_c0_g1_i3.p1  ORF type:complete len:630 (-),score=138.42 TRINITY_DN5389_c0_g1_i3:150-2039(-)